jgi:hypothetical protein
MKLKVFFTWLVIWTAAVHGGAVAQTTGKPSANNGPLINSIAPPGLLHGADLGHRMKHMLVCIRSGVTTLSVSFSKKLPMAH